MDFKTGYAQEEDLLNGLLGDDDDKREVYKQNYYDTDGYNTEKHISLYSYSGDTDFADDDLDGYGSGDAKSSGDEIPTLDLEDEEFKTEDGYSVPATEGNPTEETPTEASANNSNWNLKSSTNISRAVSVPVVLKNDNNNNNAEYQKKDWNKNFQAILALEESEGKYQKLSQIAHEFIFVAETYGKVIISEINVPADQKTIKPISIGGQAGGEKYMAQGILFKFALDVGNLYGGNDEYAQKAAGHDLKGLIQYSLAGIPGLHFPLMSLIHYMGYCLIAMSLLPIGKDSLKYGSADAGKTMHFDIPAINEKMKAAGEALNLKGHISGFAKYQTNLIYGPGDIECHLGKDGRFYVLDFARTFPPEAILPGAVSQKGQILFKLLRPELVKSNGVPLSSDAFTGFGMADPAHKTHNREVAEATNRLFTEVIPELANRVQREDYTSNIRYNFTATDGTLINEMHKEGINIRHLGNFRRLLGQHLVNFQCLIEMIARVLKNKLKKQWRSITKVNQHITEEQCKQVTVVMLNKLYSDSEVADKFWTEKVPKYLKRKFKYGLFKDEKNVDLRNVLTGEIYPKELLTRLTQIAGITLSHTALVDCTGFRSITFVHSDVEKINAVVKNMHIVDVADTQLLLWNGVKSSGKESERILSLALKKIEQNSLVTVHVNKILKLVYQLYQKTKKDLKSISVGLAKKLLDVVIRIQPKTETAYLLYAKLLDATSVYKTDTTAKLDEGLQILPESALLHAARLKYSVRAAYNTHRKEQFTDEELAPLTKHFEAATKESYLKGTANLYYAAVLLLHRRDKHEEAVEYMKVGQSLMPQKFPSILKMTQRRHALGLEEAEDGAMFEILLAIQTLISPELYQGFDSQKYIQHAPTMSDAVLKMLMQMFLKISELSLRKTEHVTEQPVVELIQSRASTLRELILKDFQDLPQDFFVEALKKCQDLVSLDLRNTNATVKDVLDVLEEVKLKVLSMPSINGLTIDSITRVVSYSSITDLNISKAVLTRDEMSTLLEKTDVSRLFCNEIESLDFALVKSFVDRNKKLVCLSLQGCKVNERDLVEYLPVLGHESLQVVVLPCGSHLGFSGSQHWTAIPQVHKFPTGSRIEIKLSCSGPFDREFPTLIVIKSQTMVSGTTAQIASDSRGLNIASMVETPGTRTISFAANSFVPNEVKFNYGSVVNNVQSSMKFFSKSHTLAIGNHNFSAFGVDVFPTFNTSGQFKIRPRTDITYLLPMLVALVLKKKAAL